jgi:hypothetical protein
LRRLSLFAKEPDLNASKLCSTFVLLCASCGSSFHSNDEAAGGISVGAGDAGVAGTVGSGHFGGGADNGGTSMAIGGSGGRGSSGEMGFAGGSPGAGAPTAGAPAGGDVGMGGAAGSGGAGASGGSIATSGSGGTIGTSGSGGSTAGATGTSGSGGSIGTGGSGGSAGASGSGGKGGSAGFGGAGGSGGHDCTALQNTYLADLAKARICNPQSLIAECSTDSALPGSCCPVFVANGTSATAKAKADLKAFTDAGCQFLACGKLCVQYASAVCAVDPSSASYVCSGSGIGAAP